MHETSPANRSTWLFYCSVGSLLIASLVLTATAAEGQSLQSELDAMAAGFAKKAPAPMRAKFAEGVDVVRRSGLVESAKNVGDAAPDGQLTTLRGDAIRLASFWAEGPAVVVFYRGGWCPYCNLTLKSLERSLAEIEGAGARLVAISPEIPAKGTETSTKNALSFAVLSDADNRVARDFGIVFPLPDVIRPIYERRIGLATYNGNANNELPLSAAYVIDSAGVIRWAFLDADYKKRAEPANIVRAVREIAAE